MVLMGDKILGPCSSSEVQNSASCVVENIKFRNVLQSPQKMHPCVTHHFPGPLGTLKYKNVSIFDLNLYS